MSEGEGERRGQDRAGVARRVEEKRGEGEMGGRGTRGLRGLFTLLTPAYYTALLNQSKLSKACS